MKYYYCKYCGTKYSNLPTLTANKCGLHPNGSYKGSHALYEGAEKSQYECKYCGARYSNLQTLTANRCQNHPNGTGKGKHEPAL